MFPKHLPFNESALERSPLLKRALLLWTLLGETWKMASIEDWYDATLRRPRGKWIWCPPPCLAWEAINQLCEVKHMYPESSHRFACPALMTGYWRKAAGKVGDVTVTVLAGCNV